MNVQLSIAAAAVAIGLAGTAGIAHYTNYVVNRANRAVEATASIVPTSAVDRTTAPFRSDTPATPRSASSRPIVTLPTIVVHPSPEVMQQLRNEQAESTSALQMPWYSFSSDAAGA